MKFLMINTVCGITSTGRICTDIATYLEAEGHIVRIAYGRGEVPEQYKKWAVRIENNLDICMHGLKARLLDDDGFGSKRATKKFVEWIKRYDPDIIHLHNLHGYYINIEILFNYLKKSRAKVIWTLHDCWAFTGHCSYFDYAGCQKWKTECHHCVLKTSYPASYLLDQSKKHYKMKKNLFSSIGNLEIVTPSYWLADLVKKSFLQYNNISVIHNGVNTDIFKPTNNTFRQMLGLKNKIIILGVANIWDHRKGLDCFLDLSKELDETYQIILIGLSKSQIKKIPENIIGISRTNDIHELANYYSIADIFINPTLEDNYPTTNLEAIACGTPVITYQTGGSPESAAYFGITVERNNLKDLINAIKNYKWINHTGELMYDYRDTIKEYLNIYECSYLK